MLALASILSFEKLVPIQPGTFINDWHHKPFLANTERACDLLLLFVEFFSSFCKIC
jgi:hypothetical protein